MSNMPTRHQYTQQIPGDFRTKRRKGKAHHTPCKLHYHTLCKLDHQTAVYQTCKLRYHTLCKLDHQIDQTECKLHYQNTHQNPCDCKLHHQPPCNYWTRHRTASSRFYPASYEGIIDKRMIIQVTIRLCDELMITIPTIFHCS
jgi:hypothetical protein